MISRQPSRELRKMCPALALVGWLLTSMAVLAQTNSFKETILVASKASYSPTVMVDPRIENAWGIALRPPGIGGHIWISNPRNASTSLYMGDVNGIPLHQDGLKVIQMDGPLLSYEGGLPQVTGQVYNAASDFPGQPVEFPVRGPASNWSSGTAVPLGEISGSAKFIFVTKDGTINAWRASTAASMNTAVIAMDYSDHGKQQIKSLPFLPAFTGVAMTTNAAAPGPDGKLTADNRIYACDFMNKIIRVIDNQWRDITAQVPFARPPGLKPEMSPYNIQELNGKLYVTYAVVDTSMEEPAFDDPEGGGHVFVYDRDGRLLHGFKDEGVLTSPWGLAMAPAGFGPFGGKLLVANFGDGTIAAFDPESGAFVDFLRDERGEKLALDGIWGLTFGNGVSLGDANALYYTAGPNLEQDGVLGRVNYRPSPRPESGASAELTSSRATTVRDFGAVGDGKADDTAAIEKALRVGVVVFPEGRYLITRSIQCDLTQVSVLSLVGKGKAYLVMGGSGAVFNFKGVNREAADADPTAQRCAPVLLENLQLVGSHAEAIGLQAADTELLDLKNLTFAQMKQGVVLTGRHRQVAIQQSQFLQSSAGAVTSRHATIDRLSLIDSSFNENSQGSLLVHDGEVRLLQIERCSFTQPPGAPGSGSAGVLVENALPRGASLLLSQCTFKATPGQPAAIHFRCQVQSAETASAVAQLNIFGNHFEPAAVHLYLAGIQGASVKDNDFAAASQQALILEKCQHIMVGANRYEAERAPVLGVVER